MMTDGFKICSRCHEVKPVSEFYKSRKSENVYLSACKECYSVLRGFKTRKPKGSRKRRQYAPVQAHVRANTLLVSERFIV